MEDTTATAVVETSAPVTAPAATTPEPSAPATPTETRPASMRDALEQTAAKRAAERAADPTVPPATAGATTTPPAKAPGPIPFDVHKTALDNARTKEAERINGEWRDYEWFRQQGVPAGDLRELAELVLSTKGDPVALIDKLAEQVAADPVHSKALTQFAAKRLAAARGATAAPDEDIAPDVEVVDGNGQVVGRAYSANALAKREQALMRRLLGEVAQEIAPLKQSHDAAIKAEQRAAAQTAAKEWSGGFGKELASFQFFTEHKSAIGGYVADALGKLPKGDPRADDPAFLEALTLRGYHAIVGPKLPALIQAQVTATHKQKAVAQTESPSRAAAAPGKRPTNPQELAAFMKAKAAERGR